LIIRQDGAQNSEKHITLSTAGTAEDCGAGAGARVIDVGKGVDEKYGEKVIVKRRGRK
jgi:hypothetical protein